MDDIKFGEFLGDRETLLIRDVPAEDIMAIQRHLREGRIIETSFTVEGCSTRKGRIVAVHPEMSAFSVTTNDA